MTVFQCEKKISRKRRRNETKDLPGVEKHGEHQLKSKRAMLLTFLLLLLSLLLLGDLLKGKERRFWMI